MPPHPRPRPRAVRSSASPISLEVSESTSNPRHNASKEEEEEEEDALFMRNKGRSLREANMRVARAAAIAPISCSPTESDDENEDEDEQDTPKQGLGKNRKQNVFNAGKAKTLPKWTKRGAIQNLLVDSDSEAENNDPSCDDTPSKKRHAGGSGARTPSGRRGKRPRTRSRSRSLTPPPALTQAEQQRAQIAIQKALSSDQDAICLPSPEVEDDADGLDMGETTVLDPELQHIVQAIRDRASKQKTHDNYSSIQQARPEVLHHHSSGSSAVVTVRVKWVPHPEDEVMRGRSQQTWSFTMKRDDSFKELFLQTSDKAHVLAEDLVLMRSGRQVFTSVSPEGLGLWEQVDLEACDRATFEALRSHHFRSPTPAQQDTNDPESEREASAPPSEASLAPDDADKFKLVLRAPGTKEITLSVRSTTTCGKIVRAFLAVVAKHGGKVPASPRKAAKIQLCIDGEKQDPNTPISDCDLEDGDMVEVVGM